MLNATNLASSFRDLVNMKPTSLEDAAKRWATAYNNYALQAMALDAKPLALNNDGLINTFHASMKKQTFLDDLPTNLTVFWMTPVLFQSPTFAGPVLAVAGAPALSVGVQAFIQQNKASVMPNPLDPLAMLIHSFTLTVLVQLTNLVSGAPVPTTLL